jgi:hypothetical protein
MCEQQTPSKCGNLETCPTGDDKNTHLVVDRIALQGWARYCDGAFVFEDNSMVLPDGTTTPPQDCHPRRDKVLATLAA